MGVTCYIFYDETYVHDVKKINGQVVGIFGNVAAIMLGDIMECIKQVCSNELIVKYPVKYCPRVTKTFFSITASSSTSIKLQSEEMNNIRLIHADGTKVTFIAISRYL